ncbi:MAG: DUF488 domain-containing protein [Candidatus Aenigmatarchaeota archaeon]
MKIFTLGHSTRSIQEFFEILKSFKIELVIDVRKFPSSKKFPWFFKENLEKELNKNKIQYIYFPELGGYRKEGYANFAKSKEFKVAIEKLLLFIDKKNAAILCSEFLWFRCHRRYIANYLAELGHQVIHIFDENKIQEHKLRDEETQEKMKLVLYCDKKARKLKLSSN